MPTDRMAALFERFRRDGDARALEQVFELLAPELLTLARRLCPRGQEAEDLVQSTFLVALSRRDRFDATRPLRPWLIGILVNRARASRLAPVEGGPEPLHPGRGPADEAQAQEFARELAMALDRLPPLYREVLREHFYEDRAPAEIARRRGEPQGTVRSRLHRALRLLRSLLPASLSGALAWIGPSRPALVRMRRAVMAEARAGGASAPAAGVPGLAALLVGLALLGTVAGVLLHGRTESERGAVPRDVAGEPGDTAIAMAPAQEVARAAVPEALVVHDDGMVGSCSLCGRVLQQQHRSGRRGQWSRLR